MDEKQAKQELKKIKREIIEAFFSLFLVLSGLLITFIFYGWKLTLAILLIGWGNNIAFDAIYKRKETTKHD